MNESKHPKSFSILFALNLFALLTTLIVSMDDIWEAVRVVIGIQAIVLVLGLILIAFPKSKGKRLKMFGILSTVIVAPLIIFYSGYLIGTTFDNSIAQKVFSLLSFYAVAIPLLVIGLFAREEGWSANPNSIRRQCFLYLSFLLGGVGAAINDPEIGMPVILGIGYAMLTQTLLLICLPIMKGHRLRLIGMGILTIIGPISLALVAAKFSEEQLKMSSSKTQELVALVLFAAAIVFSLLAMFLLRHGWIAEEAKRRISWLGNGLLMLNIFAPFGLYLLTGRLTNGGSRNEEWLMLVPGWLFFIGLTLMTLGRGVGGLQPIKPLRGSGEMSFLIGAAMLSVAFLIGETETYEQDPYVIIGLILLGILALHHVMRGFVSRWVRDSVQRFLFKWTVRGVPALIVLAIAGVSTYYALGKSMANSALAKYKATSEAEGWSYDFNDYVGEVPADDDNFFMAKPFSGFLYTQKVGEKPVYLNPTIKTNIEAVLDLKVFPRDRIRKRTSPHLGNFADQLRRGDPGNAFSAYRSPMEGTDREVIERYLAQFDALFRELQEAAKRPKHYFPYPFKNGLKSAHPHLSPMKWMTQLLFNSVRLKLALGDTDGAMDHARLQFRLFEASRSDPYLIGQIVNIAVGYIIVGGLNNGLHLNGWSDEHLTEWDTFLTLDWDYFKQWERCMQENRLSVILSIESTINGEELGMLKDFFEYANLIPKQWLVNDLIHYDTTMKRFIELIREAEQAGQLNQRKISEHFWEAEMTSDQKKYPFSGSGMLFSPNETFLSKAGRMMNLFSAARLGIAIERYRRTKGTLPGNLNELVPDYIAALPNDIFTGKPLEWEHNGSPRYKIATGELDSSSWTYDAVLAAIQAGDLDQLKAYTKDGWSVAKPGKEESPDKEPNLAGVMPGMGFFSGPKKIDFEASETEILTQQHALHHAVHSENKELVRWLIDQGLDPNTTANVWTHEPPDEQPSTGMMGMGGDGDERTVLEFAVSEQDAEMVTTLLDAGVLPIDADEEPKTPDTPATPLGMGLPGMMGGMPDMIPSMMNPFGMPGMGIPVPKSPSAFELANTETLPLLLAKVPDALMPKALEENSEVSLLRKTLAKRDLAKARLLVETGADVNHPNTDKGFDLDKVNRMLSDSSEDETESSKNAIQENDKLEMPLDQGMDMDMPGINPYGSMPLVMMPGMMGMGMIEDTNKAELTALSVVSQAARVGDWEFFQLILKRGADPKRSEHDGSTPLHHAAVNPNAQILKHLLTQQPDLDTKDDANRTAASYAAKAGLLQNIRQLEQAGANLNDNTLINAAIRSLNRELVGLLIDSAKKPLNENWNRALQELEEIIESAVFSGKPDNTIGMGMGMMPNEGYEGSMMSMHGMGSSSRSLSEDELASIRAIGTLLIENGLSSAKLKTDDDIANLMKEKPDTTREDTE